MKQLPDLLLAFLLSLIFTCLVFELDTALFASVRATLHEQAQNESLSAVDDITKTVRVLQLSDWLQWGALPVAIVLACTVTGALLRRMGALSALFTPATLGVGAGLIASPRTYWSDERAYDLLIASLPALALLIVFDTVCRHRSARAAQPHNG